MVVLDQNGVVEAHAVVHHAPGGGSGFFQDAQAGRGLAGIEDLAARALDGIGELARGGRHAAQALQEIKGNAFAGQQRARASADGGDDFAIGAAVAILLEDLKTLLNNPLELRDIGVGSSMILLSENKKRN